MHGGGQRSGSNTLTRLDLTCTHLQEFTPSPAGTPGGRKVTMGEFLRDILLDQVRVCARREAILVSLPCCCIHARLHARHLGLAGMTR